MPVTVYLGIFTHDLCHIFPLGIPLHPPEPLSAQQYLIATASEVRLPVHWKIEDSARLTVATATPTVSVLRLIYRGPFLAGRAALPGFV